MVSIGIAAAGSGLVSSGFVLRVGVGSAAGRVTLDVTICDDDGVAVFEAAGMAVAVFATFAFGTADTVSVGIIGAELVACWGRLVGPGPVPGVTVTVLSRKVQAEILIAMRETIQALRHPLLAFLMCISPSKYSLPPTL